MPADLGLLLARRAFFAAGTASFGLALFDLFAPGPRSPAPPQSAAAAAVLPAALAWLALAVAGFGGTAPAGFPRLLRTVLPTTGFGPPWLLRLAAALALVAATGLRLRAPFVLLPAAVVLAAGAGIGHAAVQGWTLRLLQVVHLLAAGARLCGLPALAATLARRPPPAEAARLLLAVSGVGLFAVAAIAVTGPLIAWIVLAPHRPALGGTCARLLLLELAPFAAMLALAARNRLRLVAALAAPDPAPDVCRLRRAVFAAPSSPPAPSA